MTKPTRKQNAEAVLAHLRAVGPQTVAEIQRDLGMTKREVEDALHYLGNRGTDSAVELAWPTTSPLRYQATNA